MKLLYSKNRKQYFPDCYPVKRQKTNPKKINTFIHGEGWKKFVIEEVGGVELENDTWNVSWMYIAKLYNLYGIEVANVYASKKTAGIVSRQTAIGYGKVYKALEGLNIDEWMSEDFFKLLKCDYLLSCFGGFLFDIVRFDENLTALDPNYDGVKSTYKDKECSLKQYIELKYDKKHSEVIDTLIQGSILN